MNLPEYSRIMLSLAVIYNVPISDDCNLEDIETINHLMRPIAEKFLDTNPNYFGGNLDSYIILDYVKKELNIQE